MYLLNEFARTVGAKDKKQRLKKGLQIAGGIAATGILAGVALKNKDKIKTLLSKSPKPKNTTASTNSATTYSNNVNKKALNKEKITRRKKEINKELGLTMFPDKKSRAVATKQAANKLRSKNPLFKYKELTYI